LVTRWSPLLISFRDRLECTSRKRLVEVVDLLGLCDAILDDDIEQVEESTNRLRLLLQLYLPGMHHVVARPEHVHGLLNPCRETVPEQLRDGVKEEGVTVTGPGRPATEYRDARDIAEGVVTTLLATGALEAIRAGVRKVR